MTCENIPWLDCHLRFQCENIPCVYIRVSYDPQRHTLAILLREAYSCDCYTNQILPFSPENQTITWLTEISNCEEKKYFGLHKLASKPKAKMGR